jgi:hypoxanthine phosphoribosyltransferase
MSEPVEVVGPADVGFMRDDKPLLVGEEAIRSRVEELGREITLDYQDLCPVVIGILKGSFVFLADLIRNINLPITVDFMIVQSFSAGSRTGKVMVMHDLGTDIKDRHVLMVEDIVDTGLTLDHLTGLLKTRKPASLELCTLLEKRGNLLPQRELKYVGFRIPDVYVVGYGLDYKGNYRNLPYIGIHDELDT